MEYCYIFAGTYIMKLFVCFSIEQEGIEPLYVMLNHRTKSGVRNSIFNGINQEESFQTLQDTNRNKNIPWNWWNSEILQGWSEKFSRTFWRVKRSADGLSHGACNLVCMTDSKSWFGMISLSQCKYNVKMFSWIKLVGTWCHLLRNPSGFTGFNHVTNKFISHRTI